MSLCQFQEYFMDLYLLAELKTISLKITTVDMKRPPADFRSNFEAAQPPILIDNGVAILENDKARGGAGDRSLSTALNYSSCVCFFAD